MNRYELAKVVKWAGTLRSRKRMQKVVYLLSVAGCPLDVDFSLHFYGPYAQEVSRLTDEMVLGGQLVEEASANTVGRQFSYRLSESARTSVAEFEATPRGAHAREQLRRFQALARELLTVDLRQLEIAATIAYFQRLEHDWSVAVDKTRKFKKLPADSPLTCQAEALARRIVEAAHGLSPKPCHAVLIQNHVDTYQGCRFDQRLGDKQPIKRVFVADWNW